MAIVSAVVEVARGWLLDKAALSVDTVVAGKSLLNVASFYARSRQLSHLAKGRIPSQSG